MPCLSLRDVQQSFMPIDLDSHATTCIDPRVTEAMLPYFGACHGNAASSHSRGRAANEVLEASRADVAAMLGELDPSIPAAALLSASPPMCPARPAEINFCSCATEANDLALRGTMDAANAWGNHLIVSSIEHGSVLETARDLERRGARLTVLPVDSTGRVRVADVVAALTPQTVIVSVMLANNEVGSIQPIAAIYSALQTANMTRMHRVLLHVDASQGVGRVSLVARPVGGSPFITADLVTISGHKICAPQGIAALWVRDGTPIAPQLLGGTHEHGLRAGTPALPLAVGLGIACRIMRREGAQEAVRMAWLRDALARMLLAALDPEEIHVNGPWDVPGGSADAGDAARRWRERDRLPNNFHVTFEGTCPTALGEAIGPMVNVSAAAACRGPTGHSHVLEAMGAPDETMGAPMRFGVGRQTTPEEVYAAAKIIASAVRNLRGQGCALAR